MADSWTDMGGSELLDKGKSTLSQCPRPSPEQPLSGWFLYQEVRVDSLSFMPVSENLNPFTSIFHKSHQEHPLLRGLKHIWIRS